MMYLIFEYTENELCVDPIDDLSFYVERQTELNHFRTVGINSLRINSAD
jgi:hypothetical protein